MIMKNEIEFWKSLPGVPGVEVSTLGNVRTLDKVTSKENRTWFTKGMVLKQFKDAKGYLKTGIPIGGKWITKRVHRLIAQTFIKNTDNLPQVNHKNCNRADNRVSNLEWCSNSYNTQYREKFGEALNRPVLSINLSTLEVSHFSSQHEASRTLGVNPGNISSVIKGRHKHAGGYWFTNADDNAADAIKSKLEEVKNFERTLP